MGEHGDRRRYEDSPAATAADDARRLIQQAADHLVEGGFAYLLASWPVDAPDRWLQPSQGWLDGRGCDAIVLLHQLEDAAEYPGRRLRGMAFLFPEVFATRVREWRAALDEAGIRFVASGAVVLRRTGDGGGEPWISGFRDAGSPGASAADGVAAIFRGLDWLLAQPSAGAVLSVPVVAAPGLQFASAPAYARGSRELVRYRVFDPDGAGVQVEVSQQVLNLVGALDGTHRVAEIVTPAATAELVEPLCELVAAGLLRLPPDV